MHIVELIINNGIIEGRYWQLNGFDHRPYHPAQQDYINGLYSWWICGICLKKEGYLFGNKKKIDLIEVMKWLEAYNKIQLKNQET